MIETRETIYCLKEIEFAVVLAACGVEALWGYPMEWEEAGDEGLIYAVHGLLKKGVCRMENGRLTVTEELHHWAAKAGSAGTVVRMTTDSDRGRCFLAYMASDGMAVAEKRLEEYRISFVKEEEIAGWMEENGLLPENVPETEQEAEQAFSGNPETKKNLEELMENGPDETASQEAVAAMEDRYASIDIISAQTGLTEARCLIVKGSLVYCFLSGRGGTREAHLCSKELWNSLTERFYTEGGLL